MKVSVCIPVYNGEKYISETIKSVLAQTCNDYELLIIDNHSTDGTVDIVKQFSDSRIRLIENDVNYGIFGNWNKCLQNAKGEYIHLLCADDTLHKKCLETKIEVLDKNPNIVLVFSASNVVDEKNNVLMQRKAFRETRVYNGKEIVRKSFRSKNIFGEPSTVMFRRNVANVVGEFSDEVHYSSDWEYWMRLSIEGDVAYINQCLTNFRVSTTSATSQLFQQREKLKEDDKVLIRRMTENTRFGLTGMDVFVHKIATRLRMYAKIFFLSVVKLKN